MISAINPESTFYLPPSTYFLFSASNLEFEKKIGNPENI
jgi:hypothetical protein